MKILISADTYYPQVNGCSYFTQRLAYYLQKQGHDVRVIAPSESFAYTDTVRNGVRFYGAKSYPIFFYPGFRFCFFPFKNSHIKKFLDEFKPDIIHFQGHFAVSHSVLGFARERNIPIVATNHFMPENLVHYLPFSKVFGPPISRFAWKDFARKFKDMDTITTPTRIAAALIQPYFTKEIKPISCGIDRDIFKPTNNGNYLKERYKLTQKPILLYVGRLDKEKNLDLVIKAFARASQKTDFQLVIAGTGAEKNNLVKLSESLTVKDRVTFLGFVPDKDLPFLYCIANCFIIAGTAELQSIVTMEAMASGLPILAVNAVALPELVQNGQNGYLFSPGNVEELQEKMVRIFSDRNLQEKMKQKSLEFIVSHDIKNMIEKFEDVYTKAIAKHV